MARSRWKVAFFSPDVWKKIFIIKKKEESKLFKSLYGRKIAIFNRSSVIPECFKKLYVAIHKGKTFRELYLKSRHAYKKFGEYAFTRKVYYYPLRKKRRKLDRR